MSSEVPSHTAPEPTRLVRISLDLGSDTTVAYVALPGETEYRRIDLQFYLKALVGQPDLLRDPSGNPSHRLKSRYAVNDQFYVADRTVEREHPRYGYTEVLPKDHPTLQLIDYDRYVLEQRKGGSLVGTAIEPRQCFFKFIEDIAEPFAFNLLVPNAKLIFQSGVGLERDYEVRDSNGVGLIRIHPVEVIKNQICLILQNFVRPHPSIRDANGRMPAWKDCAVILTVPNTYSPFHREVLSQAVGETLGCQVTTITESDAIVFYYIAAVKPDAGLKLEELKAMQQKYLTIDVGKGTTDLTLMSVTYKDASAEEKRLRGLNPEKPLALRHVHVSARTGRASGGAKMSYVMARFLEKLVDHNIRHALSELPGVTDDERRRLLSIQRSPFRLTTRSTEIQVPEDSAQSRRLVEFERLCDWYKRELDLTSTGLTLPDYTGKEPPHDLTLYLSDLLSRYIESEHGLVLGDDQVKHLSTAILEALEQPSLLRNRSATRTIMQNMKTPVAAGGGKPRKPDPRLLESDPVAPIWFELEQEVRAYVKENVDDVLIELANAHSHGNDGIQHDDAVEALVFMLGAPAGHKGAAKRRPFKIRTHIIVAGQGSQFKPLKKRLAEVIRQADLGEIRRQEKLEGTQSAATLMTPSKSWFQKLLGFFSEGGDGYEASPHDHLAVELTGSNLKDGCARGALDWFSSNPIMENPNYVHGQLIVTLLGGGHEHWIDMDRLNDEKRYELSPDMLQVFDAWSVYYLPSKGQRAENLKARKGAIMGTLLACNDIEIEVRQPDRDSSQLVVYPRAGEARKEPLKLKDALYGAERASDLREMLWPAILLDE